MKDATNAHESTKLQIVQGENISYKVHNKVQGQSPNNQILTGSSEGDSDDDFDPLIVNSGLAFPESPNKTIA